MPARRREASTLRARGTVADQRVEPPEDASACHTQPSEVSTQGLEPTQDVAADAVTKAFPVAASLVQGGVPRARPRTLAEWAALGASAAAVGKQGKPPGAGPRASVPVCPPTQELVPTQELPPPTQDVLSEPPRTQDLPPVPTQELAPTLELPPPTQQLEEPPRSQGAVVKRGHRLHDRPQARGDRPHAVGSRGGSEGKGAKRSTAEGQRPLAEAQTYARSTKRAKLRTAVGLASSRQWHANVDGQTDIPLKPTQDLDDAPLALLPGIPERIAYASRRRAAPAAPHALAFGPREAVGVATAERVRPPPIRSTAPVKRTFQQLVALGLALRDGEAQPPQAEIEDGELADPVPGECAEGEIEDGEPSDPVPGECPEDGQLRDGGGGSSGNEEVKGGDSVAEAASAPVAATAAAPTAVVTEPARHTEAETDAPVCMSEPMESSAGPAKAMGAPPSRAAMPSGPPALALVSTPSVVPAATPRLAAQDDEPAAQVEEPPAFGGMLPDDSSTVLARPDDGERAQLAGLMAQQTADLQARAQETCDRTRADLETKLRLLAEEYERARRKAEELPRQLEERNAALMAVMQALQRLL